MKKHTLKTLPEYFQEVEKGNKKFELRKNDRDFRVGDFLILQEFDPERGYTGKEIEVKVSYIFQGGNYGLDEDYCIMSIYLIKEDGKYISQKDYKKRKVVPTRLPYKERYPSSEIKKEEKSIEFLKDFNFKKMPYKKGVLKSEPRNRGIFTKIYFPKGKKEMMAKKKYEKWDFNKRKQQILKDCSEIGWDGYKNTPPADEETLNFAIKTANTLKKYFFKNGITLDRPILSPFGDLEFVNYELGYTLMLSCEVPDYYDLYGNNECRNWKNKDQAEITIFNPSLNRKILGLFAKWCNKQENIDWAIEIKENQEGKIKWK